MLSKYGRLRRITTGCSHSVEAKCIDLIERRVEQLVGAWAGGDKKLGRGGLSDTTYTGFIHQ